MSFSIYLEAQEKLKGSNDIAPTLFFLDILIKPN